MLDRLKTMVTSVRSRAGRPIFREFLSFGGSSIAVQGTRVGAGLVVASILGPETWGTWYLLNLIVAYGSLTHVGALNGMNREVPAALGRGDSDGAVAVRRTALGVTVLGTGTASVLLLLATIILPGFIDADAMALMLLLLAAHQAFGFAATSLKSTTRFDALARLQMVSAISYPSLTIAGAWAFGLPGFILGQVGAYLVLCLLAWRSAKVDFAFRFDARQALSLVKIGFPIMLVGLVYVLFSTVDRWVVMAYLGTVPLGHYSLAIMALGAVGLLPQVVAQQYYPRVAHAWAARRDTAELRRLASEVRNMTFVSVVPVIVGLFIIVPPAVRALLPAYEPGVPALLVTMFVPAVSAIGQGYGGVLQILNRQVWLLAAILLAAALNLALSALLVTRLGLVGVALGSLASFLFYSLSRVSLGALALRREEARG
jgi:O-antigen/teichoic acid export membrane protein